MGLAPTRTELIDLFWRTVWTFIAGLGGTELAEALLSVDVAALDGLKIAAMACAITAVKSFASNKLGTGTATERVSAPAGLPQPVASNFATPAGTH